MDQLETNDPDVLLGRVGLGDGRQSFLLRFRPGASLPAHEHAADEECLVMEGAIAIGDLRLNAGDYHLDRKDLPHPAIASASGALLFIRGHVAA